MRRGKKFKKFIANSGHQTGKGLARRKSTEEWHYVRGGRWRERETSIFAVQNVVTETAAKEGPGSGLGRIGGLT